MAKNGQKTNWLLDLALFAGLLLSFWLDLTGVGWHQWLGVALGVLILYHFLAHWKWVEAIGGRFFGRTARQPRIYFLIDLALLFGFYLIGLTGLVISTWLGLELGNYAAWRELHVWASIATLALGVVKIGLHQGWILSTARRYFGRRDVDRRIPAGPARPSDQPGAHPVGGGTGEDTGYSEEASRRDFLLLMGTVGAAAIVSAIGVLHDPAAASGTVAGDDEALTSLVEGESQSITSQSAYSSSEACFVRCDRRCSYPGHCKRYQDTNGNGRCDWGECV